ncbi:serine--tRNA ligase, partial [Candidatus Micrarchaeota archaeon CG11_big_fil_rev_8_21_14_0_20_47_5]
MPTLKQMRENPELFLEGLKKRNADTRALEELLSLDGKWRKLKTSLDGLKGEKNKVSLQVAEEKKKGKGAEEKIVQMRKLSGEIDALEEDANSLEAKMEGMLFLFPNTPHESVPIGKDEKENPLVRGSALKPKKTSKDALPHYEILQKMGLVDFERGAK